VEGLNVILFKGVRTECVTVNIMWKILHSSWTVVLQLQ